jgi:hypothetical protein
MKYDHFILSKNTARTKKLVHVKFMIRYNIDNYYKKELQLLGIVS